jgi:hypothetical protein
MTAAATIFNFNSIFTPVVSRCGHKVPLPTR